jgi:ERCC4-type nuclease
MKIILDVREHDLYEKMLAAAAPDTPPPEKQALPLGDIAFVREGSPTPYVLIIERKTIADLLASIKDGRYREQSFRLFNLAQEEVGARHNILYIIEGAISSQPVHVKKQIYGAITSLNYFKGFSVLRTSSTMETAELILAMSAKIEKELAAGGVAAADPAAPDEDPSKIGGAPTQYASVVKKNRRDNISAENIGTIMLAQIPGLSATTAAQIMEAYGGGSASGSLSNLIDSIRANPDCLKDFKASSTPGGVKKRVNKNVIENIKTYLLGVGTTAPAAAAAAST